MPCCAQTTSRAEVRRRVILHVLEILARAGHEEVLPIQRFRAKTGRYRALDGAQIDIFRKVFLVQKDGNVAAVALIPAVGIHIRAGAHQLCEPGRGQNVLHALASRVFFLLLGKREHVNLTDS